MFKQLGILILSICFLSIATTSYAEYVKVKVKGSVETKFIRTATTGQKKLALDNAKKEALKKYISGLDNQMKARMLNDIMVLAAIGTGPILAMLVPSIT